MRACSCFALTRTRPPTRIFFECPAAHTGSDRIPCARACMPLLCTGCRVADRPSLQSRHHPLGLQRVAPSACLAARPGRPQPPSLPDPGPAVRTAPSAVVRATQTRLARNVYSINVCTSNTSPHQTYVTARAQISNSAQGIISTHGTSVIMPNAGGINEASGMIENKV